MSDSKLIPASKNVFYFKILAMLLPVIFVLIIELLLRAFSVGDNLNLFIAHPNKNYTEYFSVNPVVGKKYFNKFDATRGTNDIFLKKKSDNTFRLFVLGSSTMVGFPYGGNLMASRILHKQLQDAYPEKEIEVVNTAITAINSITLLDYMKQLVRYEPDAVLIYAGHNEFYGAFGIGSHETMSRNKMVRNMHFKLMNWRIYQLFRQAYTNIAMAMATDKNAADSKGSLMKRIVANEDILYKSKEYKIGVQQYVSNMSEILTIAKQNNIPVFFSSLACNVKDLAPLGNNNDAIAAYNLALENLYKGDTIKSAELFYKAKDLDPVRFRATEQINEIIDSLADVYNTYYIPVKESFVEAAQSNLVGNDLMTEHVHPNIKGQFIMAAAFYKALVKSKLIANAPSDYNRRTEQYYRLYWPYTRLDSLIGDYKVRQLKSYWPFTTLDNKVTFRDSYTPVDKIDSLAFSVLFKDNPGFEELHEKLAKEYLAKGNYIDALHEYEALIQINMYWYNYYNNAANCLLKLNDLHGAEKYLLLSVKYRPTHFANLMLGEIEIIKHNFSKAANYYEQAARFANDEEEKVIALQKLYQAYCYSFNEEGKAEIAALLVKYKSSVPTVAANLEFTYSNYIPYNIQKEVALAFKSIDKGEADSALYYLNQCLLVNDAPLVYKLIGDVLYQKKNNNLLFYYNKAYNAYAKNISFLRSLCVAYYVNKQNNKANEIIDEIKAIDPDYNGLPGLVKMVGYGN